MSLDLVTSGVAFVGADLVARLLLSSSSSVYDNRPVSPKHEELGRILRRPPAVTHGPPRLGDVLHSHAVIRAAERDLGWRSTVSFHEGLRRTVEWYRDR